MNTNDNPGGGPLDVAPATAPAAQTGTPTAVGTPGSAETITQARTGLDQPMVARPTAANAGGTSPLGTATVVNTNADAPVSDTGNVPPGTPDPNNPADNPAGTHPQNVLGAQLPTAADAPAPAPAPATFADLGTDHPEVQKIEADFKSALSDAANALRQGVDNLLTAAEKDIPVLDADLIPAATVIIESRTSPRVGNWLKSLFGIAGSQVSQPLTTALDTTLLHGVQLFRGDLDSVKV